MPEKSRRHKYSQHPTNWIDRIIFHIPDELPAIPNGEVDKDVIRQVEEYERNHPSDRVCGDCWLDRRRI